MANFWEKVQIELELYDLVKGHSAFSEFAVESILKTGPDHITAIATLNGTKVVIKKSLHAKAHLKVLEAKQEIDIVAAAMTTPPYRINECIAAFPKLGIIVLGFVPGVRLDHAIRQANLEERSKILGLSGGWLRAYIGERSHISPGFSPQWWLKKRLASFGTGRPQELQSVFRSVVDHLKGSAHFLRGQPITKAAVHGDYSSMNAHYDNGCIYGVDIQGTSHLPIVQDAAKFLVWTQIQTPLLPPLAPDNLEYIHGIAAPDFSAFTKSGVVPVEEITTFLPYFIGLQLLQYIGAFQDTPIALARTKEMVTRFIQ